jgi:hypothetical protein
VKFLCVPCDTPMKLIATAPPDRGSISLTYSCPACGYEFAMLTNPAETDVVGSLGVTLRSSAGEGAAAQESKCPFSGIVRGMQQGEQSPGSAGFPWTPQAVARLETVPEFVRPMAKTGIEKFAQDKGYSEVDERVLDEAKQYFGM